MGFKFEIGICEISYNFEVFFLIICVMKLKVFDKMWYKFK